MTLLHELAHVAEGEPLMRTDVAKYGPRIRLFRGGVVVFEGPEQMGATGRLAPHRAYSVSPRAANRAHTSALARSRSSRAPA